MYITGTEMTRGEDKRISINHTGAPRGPVLQRITWKPITEKFLVGVPKKPSDGLGVQGGL